MASSATGTPLDGHSPASLNAASSSANASLSDSWSNYRSPTSPVKPPPPPPENESKDERLARQEKELNSVLMHLHAETTLVDSKFRRRCPLAVL